MDFEAMKLFWGIWTSIGLLTGIATSWISLSDEEKKMETLDSMRKSLGMYAYYFPPATLLLIIFGVSVLVYVLLWPVSGGLWIRKRLAKGKNVE